MSKTYFCYDNFFHKVLKNMESPRKNNDCYFYYYSTCTKGDGCTFRHEPSALGCETMCSFWKEGKCLNVHCSFRHMELRKNRKAIPCYWETQPGGCLKPHCPFLHKTAKDGTPENLGPSELQASELSKALGQSSSQVNDSDRKASQYNETNFGNPTVDPLVVNFEEESDNESAPTNSPAKPNQTRVVKVKTLEEIRLEKIQAESAAYYFYPGVEEVIIPQDPLELESADDLRRRILKRLNLNAEPPPQDFEVLSLDQIRQRKKRSFDFDSNSGSDEDAKMKSNIKRQKFTLKKKNPIDLSGIKIKTLAEIRAEKLLKASSEDMEIPTTCSEVSSTSNSEELQQKSDEAEDVGERRPAKRLRRKVSSSTDEVVSNKPKLKRARFQDVVESTSFEKSDDTTENSIETELSNDGISHENIKTHESIDTVAFSTKMEEESVDKITFTTETEEESIDEITFTTETEEKSVDKVTFKTENEEESIRKDSPLIEQVDCGENNVEVIDSRRDSSKLDDILLLDDEDVEDSSINLKAEEDILKDIDDLLND